MQVFLKWEENENTWPMMANGILIIIILMNAGVDKSTHNSIIDYIVKISERALKMANLLSLLFLHKVNDAKDM